MPTTVFASTLSKSVAVPVFFMITGFFYNIEENKEKKQIIKLLKLILFASILYFVWNIMIGCAKYIVKGNPDYIFAAFRAFDINNILQMIFLNTSPFAEHLWYLNAIVYVLICSYILKKVKLFKVLYWLTPVLLVADLVFGKYSVAIFGQAFDYIYVRNFLFVGIPYFTIGIAIRDIWKKQLINKYKIYKYLLVISVVVFVILCTVERYTILTLGINAPRDHYIFTTPLACSVFLLFLEMFPKENKKLNLISDIGKNNSLDIYVIHPIIIVVLGAIAKILHLGTLYLYVAPLLVFAVSIISSTIYRKLLSYFTSK